MKDSPDNLNRNLVCISFAVSLLMLLFVCYLIGEQNCSFVDSPDGNRGIVCMTGGIE